MSLYQSPKRLRFRGNGNIFFSGGKIRWNNDRMAKNSKEKKMKTQKNRRPASLMLWKGGKLPPRLMQQPAFMPQAAMYERLLVACEVVGNKEVVAFCRDVLKVYDKYDLRGHIVWDPDSAKN